MIVICTKCCYGDKVEDEIVADYAGFSGLNGP